MKIKLLKNLKTKIPHSLFIFIFLFLISTAIPVIAQSQPTPIQRVKVAQQLYSNGEYAPALKVWAQAAEGFAAVGDSLNQAMALSNLSLTAQKVGEWEQAEQALELSLAILDAQDDSPDKQTILAQTLDVQGNGYRERGQPADAIDAWQQGAKIYQQLEATEKLTQNQVNQAQALQDLGLYPRACKTLLTVLKDELGVNNCTALRELSQPIELTTETQTKQLNSSSPVTQTQLNQKLQEIEAQPPSLAKTLALRSLGDLLLVFGEPEQAQAILATSLELTEEFNSPQEEAIAQISLGNSFKVLIQRTKVRRYQNEYRQAALDAYGKAIRLSPSATTRLQAEVNQIKLLLDQQRWFEASQAWNLMEMNGESLPTTRQAVYLQIDLAQYLINLAAKLEKDSQAPFPLLNASQIESFLVSAINQAAILDNKRAQAYGVGYRGKLYTLAATPANLTLAEQYTKQALGLIPNPEAADISYQFFWQLGRIRQQQGNREDAIASYTNAYNNLESLRGDLVALNREFQFSFRDEVEPVYRELVDLDLKQADKLKAQGKNKESQELLNHARNVIESLQIAELNNYFQEACIKTNPEQIDQVDPTAAVIYPIILEDRLEVLVSLPTPGQDPSYSLSHYPQFISPEQLEDNVGRAQDYLRDPLSEPREFLPVYQQLYSWLIEPFAQDLEKSQVQTLTFVLDGVLQNIPMATLHDGNQYLIEKYAFALTPGLQLLDPKPLAEIDIRVLAAGLNELDPTTFPFHQEFNNLPEVATELAQISELGLTTQEPLIDEQFSSDILQQEIKGARFPIVHLATHGKFSSKAEETFILTWDRRIDVKQLTNLLQSDVISQRQPIELFVLSACETATGDKRAALGLSGVAVRAGARSTLSSLWAVVDDSTAKLMSEFYIQISQAKEQKINKAQALQQAELALLNGESSDSEQDFTHPHFWAPFVLIGNWQ